MNKEENTQENPQGEAVQPTQLNGQQALNVLKLLNNTYSII